MDDFLIVLEILRTAGAIASIGRLALALRKLWKEMTDTDDDGMTAGQ